MMQYSSNAVEQREVVLGIYPHPKAIGFAVMNSSTSIQKSGRRFITAKTHMKEYLRFITALIKLYQPQRIILESEHSRNEHRLGLMREVFQDIEEIIKRLSYPSIHYTRQDIRSRFDGCNKPEIAKRIAEMFDGYDKRLPKGRVSSDGAESPAMSEFDAISLCLTHFG